MNAEYATLTGTGDEELKLILHGPDISPDDPSFQLWDITASVNLRACYPSFSHEVKTPIYCGLELSGLKNLIDGDVESRFVFDTLSLRFEIYEHTLNNGPRFGYIVDGLVYTVGLVDPQAWSPSNVADELLRCDSRTGRAMFHFAFVVEYEPLKQFYVDLLGCMKSCGLTGG